MGFAGLDGREQNPDHAVVVGLGADAGTGSVARLARMVFDYRHAQFRYRPFPIALARPVLDDVAYQEFVAGFPDVGRLKRFADMGKPGVKYTLSEKESPREYGAFVSGHPLWREFHRWIKSDDFIYGALDMLRSHDVDLGYERAAPARRLLKKVNAALAGRRNVKFDRLTSRFEFSALPADGGHVIPHTDAPNKIVTMVVSIIGNGDWDPAYGGGLDINVPKQDRLSYNQMNRLADFSEMDIVETYAFEPNQAVIFVKTFNSWHSVRPMHATGSQALRKTLTIVIEAPA